MLRPTFAVLCTTVALGACSGDPSGEATTFAIPTATAAPIRMKTCKPESRVGTMAATCPPVTR